MSITSLNAAEALYKALDVLVDQFDTSDVDYRLIGTLDYDPDTNSGDEAEVTVLPACQDALDNALDELYRWGGEDIEAEDEMKEE